MNNAVTILTFISSLILFWYSISGIIRKVKETKREEIYDYESVPKDGNVDDLFFEYLKKYFSNEETTIIKDISLESATIGKLSEDDISPNRRNSMINYLIKSKETTLAIQLSYNITNSNEEPAMKEDKTDHILNGLLRQADILCFNIEINSRKLIPVVLDGIKKDFDDIVSGKYNQDDDDFTDEE